MQELKKKIHDLFRPPDSLTEQIYSAVLIVGMITAFVGTALTFVQRMNIYALISAIMCTTWVVAFHLDRVSNGFSRSRVFLFIFVLNVVLLPFTFVVFGGMKSGLSSIYMISFFVTVVILDKKTRVLTSALSMLAMMFTFFISDKTQAIFEVNALQSQQNTRFAFVLSGVTLSIMALYTIRAYEQAEKDKDDMVEKFKTLSNHDPLTTLFNRRELFRRLEVIYNDNPDKKGRKVKLDKAKCYILMYDIDNFKKLNDTYGHQFGDEVLSSVAKTISQNVNPAKGELAARYGGEEFMCTIFDDNNQHAYDRADAIRLAISKLKFGEYPDLVVTVSGGIVHCENFDDIGVAVSTVDGLLYQSKQNGKNRVTMQIPE